MEGPALVVGRGALVDDLVARLTARGHDARAVIPRDRTALVAAGIADAAVVLAVDDDDPSNLETALAARDMNPKVRLVVVQFNRTLGSKLQSALPNCSVVSLASISAATYAAIALDPSCFYAVEFPEASGRLVGFARRRAAAFGGAGTRDELEARSGLRVLAAADRWIDGSDGETRIGANDDVIVAGPLARLATFGRATRRSPWSKAAEAFRAFADEIDPLFGIVLALAVVISAVTTVFFASSLGLDPLSAFYFVVQTMTTTGYGDVSLLHAGSASKWTVIALMIAGVILTNIGVAFLSAALVRAQWTATAGLRRVRIEQHVVVCGAGRVGTRIVDFLRTYGVPAVVVDRTPPPSIVRLGRRRHVDVLTGDATQDETLDAASVGKARALVVTTDADAANVEIALASRARRPDLPVVMRIGSPALAQAVAQQLDLPATRSPLDLAGGVLPGLCRDASVRGELFLAGRRVMLSEVAGGLGRRAIAKYADRALVALEV